MFDQINRLTAVARGELSDDQLSCVEELIGRPIDLLARHQQRTGSINGS